MWKCGTASERPKVRPSTSIFWCLPTILNILSKFGDSSAHLRSSPDGEPFRCDRADLIRLGRTYDKTIQDDGAALEAGTNQFKINFDQMRTEWKRSTWVGRTS